jgi:hypothetical protein
MCHNEFFWVPPKTYAVSNPEFFSNNGKFSENFKINVGVSLCWTNRQVWEITLAKLRECIKKDRSELPKEMWTRTYQISQNDVAAVCRCANCEAVFKAEGSRSGPLLQYVNFVAENIAVEYPDVKIMTFAYVDTEDAPKNIRPAANVIIQWTDLFTKSDCYRPLSHEFNAKQKTRFENWEKIGATLAVWDYWNMGIPGPYSDPPRLETMLDAIAPDLRYFAASRVDYMLIEAEFCNKNPQNFIDLQHYLGFQLMADVSLDEEKLINEYMEGCYGPAAPPMKEFLSILRQAVKNEKNPLIYINNPVRTYINGDFLGNVYRLLNKALSLVPPNSDYYRRIQQEMITPLAVIILNPQYDVFKQTGLNMEGIIAGYRAARLSRIEQPWVSEKRREQNKALLEQDIQEIRQDIAEKALKIPLPDIFKDRKKILSSGWTLMKGSPGLENGWCKIESDPDSPTGKALVARGNSDKEEAQHDLKKSFAGGYYPNSFAIYNWGDKRASETICTDVPQDEKYHWYKIPAFNFGPGSFLWGFYWQVQVNLSMVFTQADGLPDYNVWETWISVKYTGPAYVKDSKQKNGVFLDRVILVKPEEPKK